MGVKARVCVAVLASVVALACSGAPERGSDGDVSSRASQSVAESAEAGTRDDPHRIGDVARLRDWEVSVSAVDLDATGRVLAHNRFNDVPDGHLAVIVTLGVTYRGADSATAAVGLAVAVVSSVGNVFDERGMCVIDGSLWDLGELYQDASGSGDVCLIVREDHVEGATVRVRELFGSGEAFFDPSS